MQTKQTFIHVLHLRNSRCRMAFLMQNFSTLGTELGFKFSSTVWPFLHVLSPHRGVGCIFYEMSTGRPLFPGSTVEEQLHFIFRILGEGHCNAEELVREGRACPLNVSLN